MKLLVSLIVLILLSSCKPTHNSVNDVESSTKNFDWIVGDWIRISEDSTSQTYESWSKTTLNEYLGTGCTIRLGDTVFVENLRLAEIDKKWTLEVTGVNESPTLFVMTEIASNAFISENIQNPFPKKNSL